MYFLTFPFCNAATVSGLSLTVCFVNTTSPGVKTAGTVSEFPVPGTTPPEENLILETAPFAPGDALNSPGLDAARALACDPAFAYAVAKAFTDPTSTLKVSIRFL